MKSNYKDSGFWNFTAKRYAKSQIADEASYEHKLKLTQMKFTPDSKVLEFACGTGSTSIIHAPFVSKITGIDFSKNMIAIANDKLKEFEAKNIEFICSDLESFKPVSEGYDVILAMSILHLLPDRDEKLFELKKLLRPGGFLITSTPCLNDMAPKIKPLIKFGGVLKILPKVQFFNLTELEASFTNIGFEIEKSWTPGEKKASFHILKNS